MKGQGFVTENRTNRQSWLDCTRGIPRVRSGLKFQALVTKLDKLTGRNAQLMQVPVLTDTH